MPLYVIDSVGWLAVFSSSHLGSIYQKYLTELDEIVTPTIIIYEVCKKITLQQDTTNAAFALAQMQKTKIVKLDEKTAVFASQLSIAHKLPMADSIIYATALSSNAQLVTSDAHFADLPDVVFVPILAV